MENVKKVSSIADIKNRLLSCQLPTVTNPTARELRECIESFKTDSREGVRKLLNQFERKITAFENELERLEDMCRYERTYEHYQWIAGIDEVGRGPLAGPVVTAAVILPKDCKILYVNDSKKVNEQLREALYEEIVSAAIAVSIGMASVEEIDDINILQATICAMERAVNGLSRQPEVLLIDALRLPRLPILQEDIIKGDEKSISIAAASIVAKVTRDQMMVQYDELFPEYQFAKNKGYGTSEHIAALKKYGPCPIHRQSFIRNFT